MILTAEARTGCAVQRELELELDAEFAERIGVGKHAVIETKPATDVAEYLGRKRVPRVARDSILLADAEPEQQLRNLQLFRKARARIIRARRKNRLQKRKSRSKPLVH